MKHERARRIIVTLLLAAIAVAARAQGDLSIWRVFDIYGHSKGCKMVEMHDTKLKGYRIKTYKSLMYRHIAKEVEPYLKADRKRAKKIREVVESGRIVSGYYMMAPREESMSRYVLFSNPDGDSGAIIYIEGPLSPDDIMKICYGR